MKRRQKGFTLAEVLITLVIIGVIGALTVPSLIQNTQKQEYVTALKKTYSTLSQVMQMIIAEEGSPKCLDENGNESGWACSNTDVYNIFKKYLNNASECGTNGTAGCAHQGKVKFLNNAPDAQLWQDGGYSRLILADGVQIYFVGASKNCTQEQWGVSSGCGAVVADTNGAKKPNQWGRDTFLFGFNEKGLHLSGCKNNSSDCVQANGSFGNGWTCACKVITENAMNY